MATLPSILPAPAPHWQTGTAVTRLYGQIGNVLLKLCRLKVVYGEKFAAQWDAAASQYQRARDSRETCARTATSRASLKRSWPSLQMSTELTSVRSSVAKETSQSTSWSDWLLPSAST
jgi:hypothetical protein